MQGLARLSRSSAAIVLMLAVIGVIVMNVAGRIDGERALEFIQWLVMAYFAKVAVEDGAAKLAMGKSMKALAATDAELADLMQTHVATNAGRGRMDTPSRAPTQKIKIEEMLEKARTSGPSPTEE